MGVGLSRPRTNLLSLSRSPYHSLAALALRGGTSKTGRARTDNAAFSCSPTSSTGVHRRPSALTQSAPVLGLTFGWKKAAGEAMLMRGRAASCA